MVVEEGEKGVVWKWSLTVSTSRRFVCIGEVRAQWCGKEEMDASASGAAQRKVNDRKWEVVEN